MYGIMLPRLVRPLTQRAAASEVSTVTILLADIHTLLFFLLCAGVVFKCSVIG